ncbi:MAG: hypothetical protein V2J55_20580 [Candidatus Competibacteraceae bacterium]|jgi:hypothetical protein|nr:hypothetical protein [Candidatus Competibacteraceae bacterium]
MRLPLKRWFQFILVISLVLNPIVGSSAMVHAEADKEHVTAATLIAPTISPEHFNDSPASEHDCDAPSSNITDCCCPMAFSGCGGSAIHVIFVNPFLHGIRDWQPTANADWQNRLIDVDPRPPRLFS